LSPVHWWASSWTTTSSPLCCVEKNPGEYTGRVCVSRAKPTSMLSTTPPASRNGYGPKIVDRKEMISGCRAKEASIMVPIGSGASWYRSSLAWLSEISTSWPA
jgi:hypothetical protein